MVSYSHKVNYYLKYYLLYLCIMSYATIIYYIEKLDNDNTEKSPYKAHCCHDHNFLQPHVGFVVLA